MVVNASHVITNLSGLLRIAVPEARGHDDLAMSLCLAVLPLMTGEMEPEAPDVIITMEDLDDELADWSIAPY